MRKLKAKEVASLVAGLAIGAGAVNADEVHGPLATITVTGTINTNPQFIFPTGVVQTSTLPTISGTNTVQAAAQHRKAIMCAMNYGRSVQYGGYGPRSGWLTYISNNYGWSNGFTVYATTTSTPPSVGGPWEPTLGVTTPSYSAPVILGNSSIYMGHITSTAQLINTIGHEWAHQWGANETQAEAAGDAVEREWRADSGRKCGGM